MCCIALNCIALHRILLPHLTSPCTTSPCISAPCIVLPCIALACMALHLIALHVIPSHCPESHPRALHRPGGSSWLRVTSHRSTSHCPALHPHLAASCTLLYPTSLHGSTMPTGRRVLGSGCPLPACSGPRHPPAPAAGAAHPSLPAPPGAVIPTPCRGPPALLCVSHIHHPSHPQITPALLTRLPRDAGIL